MRRIIGMAGEGVTRADGSHVYVHLAAVREDGEVIAEEFDKDGLSHRRCAKLLLSLPKDALCFAFSTNYHATKIFEGLKDPLDIFMIFHPEARRRFTCSRCGRHWRAARAECPECGGLRFGVSTPLHRVGAMGFTADRDGFTIAAGRTVTARGKKKVGRWARSTRVWDAMGFTHQSFDESLKTFGVGSVDERAFCLGMNLRRDAVIPAELTARLMRKVLDTLDASGINIKGQYRGAGSIAGTLVRQHNVRAYRGPAQSEIRETDPELATAIMSAYFGGRDEIAFQGLVKGPLYEYDLSGAYPHAMTKLPCLACGRWRKATQGLTELRAASLALVHFRVALVDGPHRRDTSWAPLPCRTEDGPVWGTNFEGWAWWPEVEAAMRGWPGLVEIKDAWTYHTTCRHKPFAFLKDVYRDRMAYEIGGRDIGGAALLKAGMAAVYGKAAQRFESAVQSYAWAGMTTSIIRAQVLEVLDTSVVSIATDAVIRSEPQCWSKADFQWRKDNYVDSRLSAFFAAPGLYAAFDGRPDGDWKKIIPAVRKGAKKVTVTETDFFGGRESVVAMIRCTHCGLQWDLRHGFACEKCGRVSGVPRAAKLKNYGVWGKHSREIVLDPLPLRDVGPRGRLLVRDLGGTVSLPFEPAILRG